MEAEKILYTDGKEVIVTDSFIKVKKSLYPLKGITNPSLYIIQPDWVSPFIALGLGALAFTLGALELIPQTLMPNVRIESISLTANVLAMVLGATVVLLAFVAMGFMRERYAIRIETVEGEKNVIVSPKREYITGILEALNHAFFNHVAAPQENRKMTMRK